MTKNQVIKKSALFVYIPLILTIVIDALGIGLVYPVFATIFNSTSTGMLPAGTPVSISHLLYGITLSAFPVGMFIGAPLLGDLSDQLGPEKSIVTVLIRRMYWHVALRSLCIIQTYSFNHYQSFSYGAFSGMYWYCTSRRN